MKAHKFVDSVVIHAVGGDGGTGAGTFRREKFVPMGGPDGGDGGRGGHVILRTDAQEDSLISLYFAPHQRAEHGGRGRNKQMHGRNGEDLFVKIPCGTEILDAESGERLADLVEPGAEFMAARGGKGGWGNMHWASATHQAPTEFTTGEEGEARRLRLNLKIVADVGLVGFPNAGKSSLLSVLTNAHPKIAPYPFTTLNPVMGTLMLPNYRSIRITDVPGLIQGAHAGAGLGDAFLRHIERASTLVLVIDMAGADGRDPVTDYRALLRELKLYNPELARRRTLVVANKMDLPEAEGLLREFTRRTRKKPLPVSAVTLQGLEEMKAALVKLTKPADPRS